MLTGEDIICFSNDWDGDPLSKKHIMQQLARRNRILWINSLGNRNPTLNSSDLRRIIKKLSQFAGGLRQVQKNIWVFTPLALPFYASTAANGINRRLLAMMIRLQCWRLGFHKPITWTFYPTSADVVGNLGEKLVLYQCVDEYSQFSDTSQQMIERIEERLLRKSAIVVVSADRLYESKRRINPNTFLVRHGVDVEHFSRACLPSLPPPADIADLPHPIIGFHGLIASWIDLDLIEKIARAHPEWSVVLLGKMQKHDGTRDLDKSLGNIHWLGRKPYADLPAYCKGFDIAIIPFVVNELTVNANPLKMREYLAAGLPVVSTDLPEAQALGNMVSIARDHDDFIGRLEAIVAGGQCGPQSWRAQQMGSESWAARVEELSELVSRHLDRGN